MHYNSSGSPGSSGVTIPACLSVQEGRGIRAALVLTSHIQCSMYVDNHVL